MKDIIVGTAGHIDHGKTALVKALTGIDCDRLKEEKERGITIDIGFAFLELKSGIRFGIVDVPGHERFVKNMLAGVGGIDLVILVIAADEGVMPQTREHMAICQLLGIKDGLVALNKADLVDEDWLDFVRADTADFLLGTFLEKRPIIAVSSKTGLGLDLLLTELELLALKVEPKSAQDIFRLPIDRVFTMRGFGSVVTGTLTSGRLRVGDKVMIYPKGKQARVRGLQVHNMAVEEASAGQRTAVNLQGIEKEEIARGDTLAWPDHLLETRALDIELQLLKDAAAPLKHMARVRFHAFTVEVMGRVLLLDREELKPGDKCFAQIKLENEVSLLPKDRFVIRSYSPIHTIGGGEVIEVSPPRRKRLREEEITNLSLLRLGSDDEVTALRVFGAGHSGIKLNELIPRSHLSPEKLKASLSKLEAQGKIVVVEKDPHWAMHADLYGKMRLALLEQLRLYHTRNPLRPGMPKEELRAKAAISEEKVFLKLISDLSRSAEIVVDKEKARSASHQVKLDPELERLVEKIEALYLSAALQPPGPEEAIEKLALNPKNANELIQVLIDRKKLVRVKEKIIFHADNLKRAEDLLRDYLSKQKDIAASQFRDLLNISRKHAIPLLEHFDNCGVTMRVGDKRVLMAGGQTAG